jgi:hypothetical protein
MAEPAKAIYGFCVELAGGEPLLIDGYPEGASAATSVHGTGDIRRAYRRSLANSIEGGTSEFCAPSWASGCSACPRSRERTAVFRGKR